MAEPLHTTHTRRGSISLLSVILLVFLLLMVAFSVDIGYLCCVRTEAQAVADAASLAGARMLSTSPAQVRSSAKACALLNKVNNNTVVLQDSDIVLGTWDVTHQTFTTLLGAAEVSANACQVIVPLTEARGNPVNLFFSKLISINNSDVSAASIAGGKRWDVIIAQDISSSYSANLPYAIQGSQYVLDALNKYAPHSMFGLVQQTGWGSTWTPLQQVGANYNTMHTSVGNLQCANNPTPGAEVDGGGPGITPPTSGSDLSTGIQRAINMFTNPTYTLTVPGGTNKAIIVSSDGASSASTRGQHPTYNNAQLDTLAQTTADAAWSQGISVFTLLYNPTGNPIDTSVLQSLVRGQGLFVEVSNPTQLPIALKSILTGNLTQGLLQ